MEPTKNDLSASFVDLLMDAVFAVDVNAGVVFASASCERIFGYTPQEMLGKSMFDMMLPEDRERTRLSIANVMAGIPQYHFENRYLRKDGEIVHIMWSARWSSADQLRIGVARDVTDRKRAEVKQSVLYTIAQAAFDTEDLPTLFRNIHGIVGTLVSAENFSVMLVDDTSGETSFAYHVDALEPAAKAPDSVTCALCMHTRQSGQPLLLGPDDGQPEVLASEFNAPPIPFCWLSVPLRSHKGVIGVLALKRHLGNVRFSAKDQELLQFACTQIATVIERQQLQGRLRYFADHDPLTALLNRRAFLDALRSALTLAIHESKSVSVFYIDLDGFKQVNDTLGHDVGDRLLQQVASRLTRYVGTSDTVARIGGDEFVVLLHAGLPDSSSDIGEQLQALLNEPFEVDGQSIQIGASVGVASYPEHGTTEEDLLKYADRAMYEAKRSYAIHSQRTSEYLGPA